MSTQQLVTLEDFLFGYVPRSRTTRIRKEPCKVGNWFVEILIWPNSIVNVALYGPARRQLVISYMELIKGELPDIVPKYVKKLLARKLSRYGIKIVVEEKPKPRKPKKINPLIWKVKHEILSRIPLKYRRLYIKTAEIIARRLVESAVDWQSIDWEALDWSEPSKVLQEIEKYLSTPETELIRKVEESYLRLKSQAPHLVA